MTLYATCDRCEGIKEVATRAEQAAWTCPTCPPLRPRAYVSRVKPKAPVACAHCEEMFTPYHGLQRFCTAGCRIASVPRLAPSRTKDRPFTTEERRRGALQAAKNKREKMPPELTAPELDIYRRGYTRGYVLGYNAQRRERGKKAAA